MYISVYIYIYIHVHINDHVYKLLINVTGVYMIWMLYALRKCYNSYAYMFTEYIKINITV